MRELEREKLKQQFNQIRDLKVELAAANAKLVDQCRESASALLGVETQFDKQQAQHATERAKLTAELCDSKQASDEAVRLQKRMRDAAQSELALVREEKLKLEGELQRARQQQSTKDKLQFEKGKQHAAEVKRLSDQLEAQQKTHKTAIKELKEKHVQAMQWLKAEHEKTKEVLATKETIADQLGKHLAEMEEKYKQDRAAAIAETEAAIAEIRANHTALEANNTRALEENAELRRQRSARPEVCNAETYTEPYVDAKVTTLEAEIARLNRAYEAAMGTSPPSGAPSPLPLVGTGPTETETEAVPPSPTSHCGCGPDDPEDCDGAFQPQSVHLAQPMQQSQPQPQQQLQLQPQLLQPQLHSQLHSQQQPVPVVDAEVACLAAISSVGQLVEWTRHLTVMVNGGGPGYYHPQSQAPQPHPQPRGFAPAPMHMGVNNNNNYHIHAHGGWKPKARR